MHCYYRVWWGTRERIRFKASRPAETFLPMVPTRTCHPNASSMYILSHRSQMFTINKLKDSTRALIRRCKHAITRFWNVNFDWSFEKCHCQINVVGRYVLISKMNFFLFLPVLYIRGCITVSNFPNRFRVYIRLCKHGKRFLLHNYLSAFVGSGFQ